MHTLVPKAQVAAPQEAGPRHPEGTHLLPSLCKTPHDHSRLSFGDESVHLGSTEPAKLGLFQKTHQAELGRCRPHSF